MIYTILIILIILLGINIALNKFNINTNNEKENINIGLYEKKEYLMTKNELKFYKQLKKITDKMNLTIFTQVSLYQIIKNKEYKDFNRIKSKSIDFVITENNGKIKLCIELDDNTHNKNKRIERDNFINEIEKHLISKMNRMYKIEKQKKLMNKKDTLDNIECAFKSAFYMHFRHLYNEAEKLNINISFYTAIFYFIREFCYASMFRYNKNGKFNVPYGGISYNRKEFIKKIEYIDSKKIKEYMEQTEIYCDDFEAFLKEVKPERGDFIFLDPPYDTEFSTYAKNEFAKKDQVRLCEYLKNTKANIMLIIKNTEFIYNLYNTKEFKIKTFDKKYLVSFQNRNDKDVEHLLITNY